MRQLKFKGFTLIELLIVVAIIAILAAIAVPNFLEAQVRSKVSRAKTDMRTLATALEAYFVDANTYVGSGAAAAADGSTVNSMLGSSRLVGSAGAPTFGGTGGGACQRITFTTYRPPNFVGQTLTTPVAYLTTIASDPFADTKGAIFGYFNANDAAWITWSYGPDTDESPSNGQVQGYLKTLAYSGVDVVDFSNNSTYNPYISNPTAAFKASYTYDATNGTNSSGDVWRMKE